jgi:hypothetical protein
MRISLSGIVFVARYLIRLLWFGGLSVLRRGVSRKPGGKTIVFLEMP